jgi:cell wall-associated NlpC family hydrolase
MAAAQSHAPVPPPAEAESRGDSLLRLMLDKGLVPIEAANHSVAMVMQVKDKASDLVISAMNFLGVTYRRGGNSAEEGFDCSGFVRYIFQNSVGLVLPRRADEQAQASGLAPVSVDDLKPGDLVFFNTLRRAFSHVGIYIGDGKFIHSPRTGSAVRVEDMRKDYWVTRFNGGRRVQAVQTGTEPGNDTPRSPR